MSKTLRIMCPECGEIVSHVCHHSGDLKAAFVDLLEYVPSWAEPEVVRAIERVGRKSGWIDEKEDVTSSPFFGGEAWTYGMFGKEDGRSVRGLLNNLMSAAGIDPLALRNEVALRKATKAHEEESRKKNVADRKSERNKAIKLFRSKASLKRKTALLDAIIAEESKFLNPLKGEEWDSLYERLASSYGGGVNPEVNKMRIEHARAVSLSEGTFTLSLLGSKSSSSGRHYLDVIWEKKFQTEAKAREILTSMNKFDGFSSDAAERALYARIRSKGDADLSFFRDTSGNWLQEKYCHPNKESDY